MLKSLTSSFSGKNSFSEKLKDRFSGTDDKDKIRYVLLSFICLLILVIVLWLYNTIKLDNRNCQIMNKTYKDYKTTIKNIPDSKYNNVLNKTGKIPALRDFYIKTAYNCCSAGHYKGDFVNKCALMNCIKQGVRCLDFEIYSYNNNPVISVSSIEKNTTKQSYNTLNFEKTMKLISNYAFSDGYCPCPNDPLILHFRIKSKNQKIYKDMSSIILTMFNNYLLSSKYSFAFEKDNLTKDSITSEPLKNFKRKVIIMVDGSNKTYMETPLYELINALSGTNHINLNEYSQATIFARNIEDIILHNKRAMTFIRPDLDDEPINPDPVTAMDQFGCQFVAMCFQKYDSYLEKYIDKFDKAGSAFIIKPKKFLYSPNIIEMDELMPQGALSKISRFGK